jgi:hypothetical protein
MVRSLSRRFSFDPRLRNRSLNDTQKLLGMQAGSANEGTIHTGLANERGGVPWLDAAAVLNDARLRRFLIEDLPESASNDAVRVLRLLRGGVAPSGADCPRSVRRRCSAGASSPPKGRPTPAKFADRAPTRSGWRHVVPESRRHIG